MPRRKSPRLSLIHLFLQLRAWWGSMKKESPIEWTGPTWNPTRGCSLALMPSNPNCPRRCIPTLDRSKCAVESGLIITTCVCDCHKPALREGCRNCYAKGVAARFSGPGLAYEGLAMFQGGTPYWTGEVKVIEEKIQEPLSWRIPQKIFVDSMSDLFHPNISDLDRVEIVAVMAVAHWHTFQVLTKRVEEMHDILNDPGFWERVKEAAKDLQADWNHTHKRPMYQLAVAHFEVPLRNVWWGASMEDQNSADYVWYWLSRTQAHVRWVSIEPMLGPINMLPHLCRRMGLEEIPGAALNDGCTEGWEKKEHGLHWAVIGLESGPRARQLRLTHVQKLIWTLQDGGVTLFVKQLGGNLHDDDLDYCARQSGKSMADPKGGDPSEWPPGFRIREFPARGA